MCKFSSKSGGVPFQISFFLGDLTRNDPMVNIKNAKVIDVRYIGVQVSIGVHLYRCMGVQGCTSV